MFGLDLSFFDLDMLRKFVWNGLIFSVQLTITATIGGVIFGTVLALMRLSGSKLLAAPATFYVNGMRSVPLVMVILWFYLLMPFLIGRPIGAEWSAIITFVAFEAAYFSEIMRAGIQSIPVLDQLASAGLKFTQGYANSPVCSPTRFALMTARYQYRLRGAAEEPINSKSKGSATLGLPPEQPTLPSLLKASGYRTALIGKWHLGYPPHFSPIKSGYEEFFGPMSGGVDYFTHCSNNGTHDLYFNEEEHAEEGYLTDLLSHRAVDYVKRMASTESNDQPFFLSLHYTAPHWPWETRNDGDMAQSVKSNLFHLDGGNIHTYHRMIHHMDEGIGWLVDALRESGQLDNTLIVFTSDNGGERFSDNWPLVGGKMDLTEGGIRVPWIAHWPAVIPAGTVSEQHCLTMDWSATMLDLGSATIPKDNPLDGITLKSVLQDPSAQVDRPMFWRMNHRGQRAMRSGSWKYLRVDGNDYLFNIDEDARERANLAHREPARLAAMKQAWEDWQATVPSIPEDATVSLGYSYKDMPQR